MTDRTDPCAPPPSTGAAPTGVKKAMDYAAEGDWTGYYSAVLGKPPRETLVAALDLFDREGASSRGSPRMRSAIDLACGEGRDTLELLRRGWRVLATESDPAAFDFLRPRVPPEWSTRLETVLADFRTTPWRQADLVNSSFALPFCPPGDFPAVWERIVASLGRGGRFAGQLFGDRDTWSRCGRTMGIPRAELDRMLRPFETEELKEEEKDDTTATGGMKHWHVYHIVARKR